MHLPKELIITANQETTDQTNHAPGDMELFKNFATSIITLIGLSLIVQLVIHLFTSGF